MRPLNVRPSGCLSVRTLFSSVYHLTKSVFSSSEYINVKTKLSSIQPDDDRQSTRGGSPPLFTSPLISPPVPVFVRPVARCVTSGPYPRTFSFMYTLLTFLCLVQIISVYSDGGGSVLYQFTTSVVPIEASVTVYGRNGVNGTVTFTQQGPTSLVAVQGVVYGLPVGWHSVHVYQYGNVSDDCSSVGGHFDVGGSPHGSPTDFKRHVGDLGNIKSDSSSAAIVTMVDQKISLIGPHSIIGRSLVINKNADDMGRGGNSQSLINGNAGPPLACGIIAITRELES